MYIKFSRETAAVVGVFHQTVYYNIIILYIYMYTKPVVVTFLCRIVRG